jgi:hypothetical protein
VLLNKNTMPCKQTPTNTTNATKRKDHHNKIQKENELFTTKTETEIPQKEC